MLYNSSIWYSFIKCFVTKQLTTQNAQHYALFTELTELSYEQSLRLNLNSVTHWNLITFVSHCHQKFFCGDHKWLQDDVVLIAFS